MKQIKWLQEILRGLAEAFGRYPLTALFLLAAAAVNAADIATGKNYNKLLVVFTVGAFIGLVMQAVYERFLQKPAGRRGLMAAAVILTACYYLIVMPVPQLSLELEIRTGVAVFALLVAFIWIPSIRSLNSFNESFMIAFKAFFNALLFSGVIMAGISIIITATDRLLFSIDSDVYSHVANIVFILFGPMYFLSLIPMFPGAVDGVGGDGQAGFKRDNVSKAAYCPRFLEILASYIIVPLISIFTVILVIYILGNIGGSFWTDNLLEPMLISYSICIILVYILVSRLENRFAVYFRLVFPKVLVPIVVFQIVASLVSLGDTGMTHSRYYVLLYGVFAAASGIVLSIVPVEKNGWVAAMLVLCSVISIVPPIDAFTVSRVEQTARLERVLVKNSMLEGNSIKPNAAVPEEDRKDIVQAYGYLRRMGYTERLGWLPEGHDEYGGFKKVFGFDEYDIPENRHENVYLVLEQHTPLDISGYDTLVDTSVNMSGKGTEKLYETEKQGKKYSLVKQTDRESCDIVLYGEGDRELISFSAGEVFDRLSGYSGGKGSLTREEATFSVENAEARIRVIVRNVNMDKSPKKGFLYADLYILVAVK